MKSLLIGCGNSRDMKVKWGEVTEFGELTTIDMNPDCGADIVMGLPQPRLPFEDGRFDHLAAYDSLEHWGSQGDWRGFFDEFAEYHRILKPGGTFGILVPIGEDAIADPGHTRFFNENWFCMLSQNFYKLALEDKQPITDYRWYWGLNFDVLLLQRIEGHHLAVVLRKPL